MPSPFRKEFLEAQKHQSSASIVLLQPFPSILITAFFVSIALGIILFLYLGSYTNRTTVEGQLLPVSGLVRVYAPSSGIITAKNVQDGDLVKKNSPLFTLSTTRFNHSGDVQSKIQSEAELKRNLLSQEYQRLKRLHQTELNNLNNSIYHLQTQLINIQRQINSQYQKIALSVKLVKKYQNLVNQDAASNQELTAYESDLLDQQSHLDALKREESLLQQQLKEQKNNLDSLPIKQKTELSQLERAIATIDQEILDLSSRQEQIIRASKAGYITTSNVEIGEYVDPNRLLLSIIPKETVLQASLYVPSRAIGFIKPKDPVILRYQAYPYQKFGHAKGKILSIAKTALGKQELSNLGMIFSNPMQPNEPVYLVKVQLEKQSIKTYGIEQPLQIGMLVEADILHENKRLYEWAFESLYSISGKIN
ncbi:HlyD family secretion protein [Conchiformibius steedae]|uniref:HlyD family efflux transporter periplasmic adaptor subunit n=1 Tax=Conchiformibius steedae TaxID=153493 RepID=A0A3P2ABB6_9NEIS|nr:HlyD family efflux transporter periplasmic adaptor subunit [Conchiformibius steedae]RRD90913.1 HlyD family efflux transporter periplasmic adaptor subunit [Conchiformibius steedae]